MVENLQVSAVHANPTDGQQSHRSRLSSTMAAYLHSLATAVPPSAYGQEKILEVMMAWHGQDRRTNRLLGGIYRASAIDTRHSVVTDFQLGSPGGFFFDPTTGAFLNPSTAERNAKYAQEAGKLASCAARRALSTEAAQSGKGAYSPADVTHLITVSCTGFYAPGPDLDIVRELGLAPRVERYHLGFMGCYGAFPAMRLARSICLAHESALVLIVAVELCSLHLQAGTESDELLAASVFSDGAAAALVSARPPAGRPSFSLRQFNSALATEASDDMAWTIGDTGFTMTLSNRVPKVVEREVRAALAPLWECAGISAADVGAWAVHPGGRAILDGFEAGLELPGDSLTASREVLSRFGNMSSATILFVLDRLLRSEQRLSGPVAAVAFGPGLAVESALLDLVA